MNNTHHIEKIVFRDDEMIIIVDGDTHTFKLADISQKLLRAALLERERYEISPSGYGIHWPLLDEDLSIDGLLGIHHSPSFIYRKAA